MATSNNIFQMLENNDSDEEQQQVQTQDKGEVKQKQNRVRTKKTDAPVQKQVEVPAEPKQDTKREKGSDNRVQKGVSGEPHPQDRKSGNNKSSGVQKNDFKKGGHGNVGTLNDELKEAQEGEQPEVEEKEGPVVPEVPEVKVTTLADYYASKGSDLNAQYQANEAKVVQVRVTDEATLAQFKKEKLQLIKNKQDVNAEEKKTVNQKTAYKVYQPVENAELLGFMAPKVDDRGDRGDRPRREGQGEKKPYQNREEGQGEKKPWQNREEGQGERKPWQNKEKPAEGVQYVAKKDLAEGQTDAPQVEGDKQEKPARQDRGDRGANKYSGNRGGNRDNRDNRDNRGKNNYSNKNNAPQGGFNAGQEQDFPKLG